MRKRRPYVGQITIAPKTPLKVARAPEDRRPVVPEATKALVRAAGLAFRAYYRELKRLREGQFAAAIGALPPHLTLPLRAYVICTRDVVFLREDLDPRLKRNKILAGSMAEPPEAAAQMLSEKTLYFVSDPNWAPDPNEGVQIQLTCGDRSVGHMRIGVAGRLPDGHGGPEPQPFLQITRDIVTELYGHALGDHDEPTHEFIVRARLDLPVGWQRVVAFAPSTKRQWSAEFGKALALRSLMTALYNASQVEAALAQFDPMRGARNTYSAVIDAFEELVSTAGEEPVHQYLVAHPELLFPCRAAIRSKVPFGSHVSDLVVREPDGTYTLVELESPKRKLFTQAGDPTADLTHAMNQVTSWRRYIEDNVRTVQDELGLPGITTAARTLVVIGRSAELNEQTRRTLLAMASETRGREILTYDDVVDRARTMCTNLFGPAFKESGPFRAYVRPIPSAPAA